jgi:hypothetical protein
VTPLHDDLLRDRLLARIKLEGAPLDPCWRWTGATDREGVGRMKVDSRSRPVHRVAYEAFVGSIPAGMELGRLETCGNAWCANPAHREPMTRMEILIRSSSITSLNRAKTHCKHGHPFDAENTQFRRVGRYIGRGCKACRRARRLRGNSQGVAERGAQRGSAS